jgi:hypothetical protein
MQIVLQLAAQDIGQLTYLDPLADDQGSFTKKMDVLFL